MIAAHICKLWEYNVWAWRRVYVSVDQLDEGAYRGTRPIFQETSLHAMLVHALSAEYLWLSRCLGSSPDTLLHPDDFEDFTAVVARWRVVHDDWTNFLRGLEDEHLGRVIEYRTTAGEPHRLQLLDIVQHVVNHATEHRSQLTPILYQLGLPTEGLDYSLFCHEA